MTASRHAIDRTNSRERLSTVIDLLKMLKHYRALYRGIVKRPAQNPLAFIAGNDQFEIAGFDKFIYG